MTDQPASLNEALAVLQTRLPKIDKASKAQYGNYANLTDVSRELLPVMGELGLSFTCKPTLVYFVDEGEQVRVSESQFVLEYALRHHPSGEFIQGRYPLPGQGSPQAIGSAITYARRYVLCAVTGAVAEEDDDGHAASPPAAPAKRGKREPPPERAPDALPRNRDGGIARSQATDTELEAAGNMTAAQLREHNRLERDTKGTGPQGTQRLTATPDDDPWYADPPQQPRVPRAAQNPAQAIAMHFQRLGVTDRDIRLGYTGILTGRTVASGHPVATTNDLTAAEGLALKAKLEKCKDAAALERLLEEASYDGPLTSHGSDGTYAANH